LAIGAVLAMFPVAMIEAFGVSAGARQPRMHFAAALSLAGYPLASAMSKACGALSVLRVGFAVRAVAIAMLTIAFLSEAGGLPLCLAGFVILILAWPLLAVSGTAFSKEGLGAGKAFVALFERMASDRTISCAKKREE
jgi:hypothetical protein